MFSIPNNPDTVAKAHRGCLSCECGALSFFDMICAREFRDASDTSHAFAIHGSWRVLGNGGIAAFRVEHPGSCALPPLKQSKPWLVNNHLSIR